DGTISTVAGTGQGRFAGDGGPAASAAFNEPYALAVDCVDSLYIVDHANHRIRKIASAKLAGLPEGGTVVSWTNARSRLRMGVRLESLKDGAEIRQYPATPREHQKWRLLPAGQDEDGVLYRIENLRSGKVLSAAPGHACAGAELTQRAYEGGRARHQQWRLVPAGP
ncbi:hypothetical protein G3I76_11310, partial [Streptomyces sp. SID11233]|nr:hypothetical protein [Streptomyces sp. SID11233]